MRLSDEEWLALINECRTSGMTDKAWCEVHDIHTSKFYYHIKRLRNKSCEIPDVIRSSSPKTQPVKQEVVAIDLSDSTLMEQPSFQTCSAKALETVPVMDVAIRVNLNGIQLEISNHAAQDTIFNTLSALQKLC